jgi:hypothetical protein
MSNAAGSIQGACRLGFTLWRRAQLHYGINETSTMHLVLSGMQNWIFGPYWVTIHRILIPIMYRGVESSGQELA